LQLELFGCACDEGKELKENNEMIIKANDIMDAKFKSVIKGLAAII
jgi:hypothetical protein